MVSAEFSGPIPHPSLLAEYDKIQPGLVDRITTMAEKEQSHRHAMQDKALSAEIADTRRDQGIQFFGQICGLAIGVVSVGAGVYTVLAGNAISGAFIGVGGVASLVTVFVYGSRRDAQNPPEDS